MTEIETKKSKTEFILSCGDLPAKEVVVKAKEQGLEIAEKYVYTARSNAKRAKKAKRVKSAEKRKTAKPGLTKASRPDTIDKAIRRAGLDHAIETLQKARVALG